MATSSLARAVLAFLCLLLSTSRGEGPGADGGTAHVSWQTFTTDGSGTGNPVSGVTIISSNGSHIPLFSENFTNISLPESSGPWNYWSINVSCIEDVTLEGEYLFLNSSEQQDLYYTLCFYGNCGMGKKPSVFVQVLTQESPPTPKLGIDEALLSINNSRSLPVSVSQRSDNCYKCKPFPLGEVVPGQIWNTVLGTSFGWTIYVDYNDSTSGNLTHLCKKHLEFSEESRYTLNLDDSRDSNCILVHDNMVFAYITYLPILYASVVILGLALLWVGGKIVWLFLRGKGFFHYLHLKRVDRVTARDLGNPRKMNSEYGAVSPQETEPLNRGHESSVNNGVPGAPADQAAKSEQVGGANKSQGRKRLASLDAFRGFSLVIMIFVNYGGGGYWFFNHSTWNGVTVADLVFPWFIWIMGVSIVFSYRSRREDSLWSRVYQILRRTVILFSLGLFLNNGFSLGHWRIPGVLQRFAVSYFVVAFTELFTSSISQSTGWPAPSGKCLRVFRDVTANAVQWSLVIVLELLWLAFTFLLPLPHPCPRGYLGPGGLSEDAVYYNCTGGAAGAIDRWLFTDNHIYQTPTAKETYHLVRPYDPEGVLGSLNSIVLCLLGVQAGRILVSYKKHYNILIRFILWGLLLGALGLVLCEGQKNEGVIPLNKNLWSLSFILVMAGLAFILLALFYFFIDVILWWSGAPFKYPGMNSILVYVGSEVLQDYFPFSWQQQNNSHLNLLFANLIAVILWIAISYYWFTVDFFVKI